jgi:hypothetical protein
VARNFYYGSDARVVSGSKNFAALLSASAESFGVSPEQAAEYQTLDAVLQEKYLAAVTPETRTPVAVRAKDEAMKAVQRRAAALAGQIASTETVNDAQLVSLGLQRRPTRAARPVASSRPTVVVVSVVGRVVKLRINARSTEGTRLARGAIGADVFSFVGDEPPSDPRQYHYEVLATRETVEIVFPNEVPSGATAWVAAAWVSKRGGRGERGPACVPVRVTIQGGPVVLAGKAA